MYIRRYDDGGFLPFEFEAQWNNEQDRMFNPVGPFTTQDTVPNKYVAYDGVSRVAPQWTDPDPRAYLRRADSIDYNATTRDVPVSNYNRSRGSSAVLEKQRQINQMKRAAGDTDLLVEDGIEGPKTRRATVQYFSTKPVSVTRTQPYAPVVNNRAVTTIPTRKTVARKYTPGQQVRGKHGVLIADQDGNLKTPYQLLQNARTLSRSTGTNVYGLDRSRDIDAYNKWAIANKKPAYRYNVDPSLSHRSTRMEEGVIYKDLNNNRYYYKNGNNVLTTNNAGSLYMKDGYAIPFRNVQMSERDRLDMLGSNSIKAQRDSRR